MIDLLRLGYPRRAISPGDQMKTRTLNLPDQEIAEIIETRSGYVIERFESWSDMEQKYIVFLHGEIQHWCEADYNELVNKIDKQLEKAA